MDVAVILLCALVSALLIYSFYATKKIIKLKNKNKEIDLVGEFLWSVGEEGQLNYTLRVDDNVDSLIDSKVVAFRVRTNSQA